MVVDTSQNFRLLKAIVIGLGVAIVVVLGVIIVTIVQRSGGFDGETETVAVPSFGATALTVPDDAEIMQLSLSDRRLVMLLRYPDQSRSLLVVDLATGRSIGTIRLTAR